MDSNNWMAGQGQVLIPGQVMGGDAVASSGIEDCDWRNDLQPDFRLRVVNQTMETLKRHLPFSGQEGLHELKKIAIRFEEKIYTAATSQHDYLRKISLKLLTMESKSQNHIANSLQPNAANNDINPQDPDPDPVVLNPEQPLIDCKCDGSVRLARDLLQTVVRRWRGGEENPMEDYLTIEEAYKALGGDSNNHYEPQSSSRDEYGGRERGSLGSRGC